MATYTNESLQSINKKDMIPIALSLQNKLNQVNNKVLVEIHKLSNNFSNNFLQIVRIQTICDKTS